jgi:hypothetical protein
MWLKMTKGHTMTLDELIDRLTELRDDVSGDSEIFGAFQPNYPLTTHIAAITTLVNEDEGNAKIYVALGDADNYGSRNLWDDELIYEEEDDDDEDAE